MAENKFLTSFGSLRNCELSYFFTFQGLILREGHCVFLKYNFCVL